MGWDLHFWRSKKISEILADEEFGIDGDYIYTTDEDGKRHGIGIDISDENFKDEYLNEGHATYNGRVIYFLYKLYIKFGIWFADTCLDDWFYLQDECENKAEEDALWDNCFAHEIVWRIGKALPEDDEIFKVLADTQPIVDMLYERYKISHNWNPEEQQKKMEEAQKEREEERNKRKEEYEEAVESLTVDDEDLPF